jgi:hypothetical protein
MVNPGKAGLQTRKANSPNRKLHQGRLIMCLPRFLGNFYGKRLQTGLFYELIQPKL